MKSVLYIVLLLSFTTVGQGNVGYLVEEMPLDSLQPANLRTHTSLKPAIRLNSPEKNTLSATILGDLNLLSRQSTEYKLGIGAELEATINKKWYIRLAGIEGLSTVDSIFKPKSHLLLPQKTGELYTDIRSRVSYTPDHIFNFQIGLDHNFIGEGSRSLLLSDYGTSYPFGLIRANFWRFEYSVLYQFMKEGTQQNWEGKFMSSHHISFNPTKWLNIGIFESVIFQPKDTNLFRGFDVEYLNPLVFYRPQEYALGSSDNVLLGLELSADWKEHTLYSQFILDEFYLAELRAKSGWWANKFGGQVGLKGRFNLAGEKFFYRTEYNFVRPYTFSHLSQELNYGNQGYALAHPYGSNFMEVLGELKWEDKKWTCSLFANYVLSGKDHDGYSYGGNIYASYTNRPYEYGHFIGQGIQENRFNGIITASYKLLSHGDLRVFAENHFRYSTQNNPNWNYMLVVGLRSRLWNDYRNY